MQVLEALAILKGEGGAKRFHTLKEGAWKITVLRGRGAQSD